MLERKLTRTRRIGYSVTGNVYSSLQQHVAIGDGHRICHVLHVYVPDNDDDSGVNDDHLVGAWSQNDPGLVA